MELNDAKFPNYFEVRKKFNLDYNKELAKYIDTVAEENKQDKVYLMNCQRDSLEFEGPAEQIKAFEAKRKEINDALLPRTLSILKTLKLALDYELSLVGVKCN